MNYLSLYIWGTSYKKSVYSIHDWIAISRLFVTHKLELDPNFNQRDAANGNFSQLNILQAMFVFDVIVH